MKNWREKGQKNKKNKLAEKPQTELPGLSSNFINSHTTLNDLIATEGIPHS
jgi:hypothetical protein